MYLERPLASLPCRTAERFVRSLFAPDQRFARAFHHYWRVVLGQNEATAKLNTLIELDQSARAVLERLDDPHMFTIAAATAPDEPVGIFGYRELGAHQVGAKVAGIVAATPALAARCRGVGSGIAHCVAILDAEAGLDALKVIFSSIATKAGAAGHGQLYFFTSDHRLERLYRRFGMEFPAELVLPGSRHLVGMFDVAAHAAWGAPTARAA
jgi:hypothetical protein